MWLLCAKSSIVCIQLIIYLDRSEVLFHIFLFVKVCSMSNPISTRHSQLDDRSIFIACFQNVAHHLVNMFWRERRWLNHTHHNIDDITQQEHSFHFLHEGWIFFKILIDVFAQKLTILLPISVQMQSSICLRCYFIWYYQL